MKKKYEREIESNAAYRGWYGSPLLLGNGYDRSERGVLPLRDTWFRSVSISSSKMIKTKINLSY